MKTKVTVNKEKEWGLVVYWDVTKSGKTIESESCVPMNWLSNNNKLLWWPNVLNVKDKIDLLPDRKSWSQFDVIKLKFRGNLIFSSFVYISKKKKKIYFRSVFSFRSF